jgi:hypothetical protein
VYLHLKSKELDQTDLTLLLQAIRDCEQKNFKEKLIWIEVEAPELKVDQVEQVMGSINPPFLHGPIVFKFKND